MLELISFTLRFVHRQRRLPAQIKNAGELKRTMLDARKTKEENRRSHTREGESKPKAERKSECLICIYYDKERAMMQKAD